ncbi:hypothetical protein [Ferrovum sp.]|uniref:hypothetical protein n=1 Tax=Ferrovum sp. TaxID=2609467 RepID=UPI00261E233F|nr:hypothetical protein [Ferrovum sp.]
MQPVSQYQEIERAIVYDDGQAAREHLEAGRPIYFMRHDQIIKKFPDGREQVVDISDDGVVLIIQDL